jgi:tetratricopeptide (TPR) repeat protein
MIMRRLLGALSVSLLALHVMGGTAFADDDDTSYSDDAETCATGEGDQRIDACTRLLAWAYASRASEYRKKDDADRAFADYEQAIKLYKGAIGDRAKGGDDRDDEARRRDPQDFIDRGLAYLAKGDTDNAISEFTFAIVINPRSPAVFINRGDAYRAKGEYDRAIHDYDEAIRLDPKISGAYLTRGDAYQTKGDNDRAIADYDQAIRLDPKHAAAYNNRGYAYLAKGDNDRAIADFDQAIRLDPDDATPYGNRGEAYRVKGDHDRAITDLDAAIRLDPTSPAAYTNRGLAYEKKGDRERARADFNAALAIPQKYSDGKWAHDTARERLAILDGAAPAADKQPASAPGRDRRE